MTELLFRKAIDTDIDYLLWLRKETMYEHLLNSGLSLSDDEQLIRIHYLYEQARIIMLENQNIGLLKLEEKEDSIEIVQIQIEPKFQGRGIGQQIINTVIKESVTKQKQLFLSVLKENPAKELYLRIGFKIIGEEDLSYIMSFDGKD